MRARENQVTPTGYGVRPASAQPAARQASDALRALGWNDFFENHFQPCIRDGLLPARVVCVHRHALELHSADGLVAATCAGRLLHAAAPSALPAVGDWVAMRPRPGEARADVHAVLPRRSCFSRQGVQGGEQVIATNLDSVFLVSGLDANFNLRRIERYLAAARESGARAVVVLNKADLHPDPAAAALAAGAVAPGVPVVALSAAAGDVLGALSPWLAPGQTVALLGSSGAGKSTLINRIVGTAVLETGPLTAFPGKGRHTTTRRELIVAPSGALVIDTPGMRELQLWDVAAEAIDATFADVAAIAQGCRFRDCRHDGEPGCAIQAALEGGTLDQARWGSYLKLQREEAYATRKVSRVAAVQAKAEVIKRNKALRRRTREKEGGGRSEW